MRTGTAAKHCRSNGSGLAYLLIKDKRVREVADFTVSKYQEVCACAEATTPVKSDQNVLETDLRMGHFWDYRCWGPAPPHMRLSRESPKKAAGFRRGVSAASKSALAVKCGQYAAPSFTTVICPGTDVRLETRRAGKNYFADEEPFTIIEDPLD